MKPGDVIVARRGRKRIIGVGEVSGEAFYDMDTARRLIDGVRNDNPYPNFLPVKWEEKDIRLNNLTLAMDTVVAWDQRRFDLYLNEPESEAGVERELDQTCEAVGEQEFVLEKYLEDFIVSNFKTIFKGELELYHDEEVTGQQYMTATGPIDILARDQKTGDFVVIELKKGRPSDHVIGQILRYMGWVQEELAEEGQKVRGLVVCKDDDEKMRYALKAIPQANIDVKFYKVNFNLL